MPRRPILNRELLYETLPDGTLSMLPWCLVNTELGAMVEQLPQPISLGDSKVIDVDVYWASFTKIRPFDENELAGLLGTSGTPLPQDRSR